MSAETTDAATTPSDDTFAILETLAAPSKASPSSVARGDGEHLSDRNNAQQAVHEGENTNLKSWRAGAFIKFTEIVKKAKGAASTPVVHFIKTFLSGTKLILVIGKSGAGKSTLLQEITGQELHIGKTHKSGTKAHQICPAIIEDDQYLFVDTPGFGAADMNDMEIFNDILTCLEVMAPFVTIAGVFVVFDASQPRMMQSDTANLQWLKCFCGPEFYQNITVVTTRWDSMSSYDIQDTWEKRMPSFLSDQILMGIFEPPSTGLNRYHGANIYHHGIPISQNVSTSTKVEPLCSRRQVTERRDQARAMIRARYEGVSETKLQTLTEIGRGIPWHQTEAAKVLRNNISRVDVVLGGYLARVALRPAPKTPWEADSAKTIKEATSKGTDKAEDESAGPVSGSKSWAVVKNDNRAKHISDPDPEYAPKPEPYHSEKTWPETLLPWLEAAKEVAVFYFQSKQKVYETTANSWSNIWGKLSDWWSGSSPCDQKEA